jgi:hypothetical protein
VPAPKKRRAAAKGTAKSKRAVKSKRGARKAASRPRASKAAGSRKTTKSRSVPVRRAVQKPTREEEAAFTEALIQSGEAACLDEQGKLPAGATHKLVDDPAGGVKAVRRRFSMA